MKRNSLISLLDSYIPVDDNENDMYKDTVRFVTENPDCFERTLEKGHVTASGWVVSPDRSMALLMHHRKLDRWFQPGGHCDGNPSVEEVARKEVWEETGVRDLELLKEGIFDVDVHLIPANKEFPAHYHYDIRFIFKADPFNALIINSESKDVQWIPVTDIEGYNNSESIIRMVRKTIALSA